MTGPKKTKALCLALLLAQVAVSLFGSAYAVENGAPYVGIGSIPWWRYIPRLPWLLWFKVNKSADLLTAMMALFIIYTVVAFLILRYLIMKPIVRKLTT